MDNDPFDKIRIEPRPLPNVVMNLRQQDERADCEKCLRPFRRSTEQRWRKLCGCCR